MNNAMQKKIILGILSLVLSMIAEVLKAEIVHDFSKSNLEGWYVIDDGVMGGRSRGQLEIENDDIGLFSGRISLQNYGGFSSIRYYTDNIKVKKYKYITMIINGDNKYYQLRIKGSRNDRYVYTSKFFAKNGWQQIRIPLAGMEPYFRGRKLNKKNFDKKYITELGFLIGNKVPENFELRIRSILLE
ncbi:CIA30 family protein [Candidatus Marinimicrobia bacterium]|nr:CIA30 family protein [Candidatus Neomarinimicrobiota bacterium]